MSDTFDLKYHIALSRVPGIGRVRLGALKSYFGGLAEAWKASEADLLRAGLDSKTAGALVECRRSLSPEHELEKIHKYGITAVTFESPQYPALLQEVSDSPAILYVRGKLQNEDAASVAIVGTRRSTAYGRQVTEELVAGLVSCGITIVSGLAKGIDAIAHRATIDARGRTLAVFACGLDIVYPPENSALAREIMECGALVSEYPLGTQPKAENFPRRNRILSGLSRGVVVIESGEKGGALITAGLALEQNREVFAVPGSVFSSMSKGPNRLIQEGAKLVRNHLDVIEELDMSEVTQQLEMKSLAPADAVQSAILGCTGETPTHVDEICRSTGLSTSIVLSNLAMMELNGMVRQMGGMTYAINKRMS